MRYPCALMRLCLLPAVWLADVSTHAQQTMPDMPGMTMPMSSSAQPMAAMPGMFAPATLIDTELQHSSSGTSIEPSSTPHPMLMSQHGAWMLMLHGTAFLADTQQHATDTPSAPPQAVCNEMDIICVASNRRGADKLFSTNWVMPMAMRQIGRGELTVRTMLSLEPATVTGREYPELFQQGETAYGKPIVDGQHPHDFVMELAALYDLRLGQHALLSLYAAPVGDPAIGPTAYPHRMSASEDPIAALGHHQEDSTHIAFNVLTAGLTFKWVRVEGSGFHGAEPDEQRWHFQPSPNGLAVDSYATRITVSPTPNWSGQYSIAHITSPEALRPTENQRRQTASAMYNRPLAHEGNWSNTLLWGQTRTNSELDNSYLLESLLKRRNNFFWTRIESAARTTDLLIGPTLTTVPPESSVGHVQAYTLGYDHDLRLGNLRVAPGAQFTVYRAPDDLVSTYGRTPFGAVVFLRVRVGK